MDIQDVRPRFYEGQYLGAADLSTIVDYTRTEGARHALGAHTWGIAIGLQLTEKPAPGGANRVEVTLQPGFAWDGFARPIANGRPTRLNEALFAAIPFHPVLDGPGGAGRLVEVWLAYAETASGNPLPGFETCATDDQHARIGETFRFVIGQQTLVQRRAPVRIGTTSVDAAKALQAFDPGAPLLYDASVPHQLFPFDDRPPVWLIPIGYVRWIARDQALGYFAERDLDPADKADGRIRAFRRYAGAVAERIEAAAGAIVLHERGSDPLAPHRFATLLGSTLDPTTLLDDLVWVEGNLRVVGNAKLAGGDLLFSNGDGLDEGVPFYIARRGDDPPVPAAAARELRVAIGPNGDPANRLMVGPEMPPVAPATTPSVAPHFVVVSSGDVGIGRRDPETRLNVVGKRIRLQDVPAAPTKRLDLRTEGTGVGLESTTDSITISSSGPANQNQVLLNPGAADGRVGIRVASPQHDVDARGQSIKLGLEQNGGGQFVLTHLAPDQVFVEARNAAGTAPATELRILGPNGAPLPLVNVQATQTQFSGDVGVGGTPTARLTAIGKVPGQGVFNLFPTTTDVSFDGGVDGVFVFQHLAANGVTAFMQPRMGVGTATPQTALHVAGDFLRVDGLGNEQAYLGGDGFASDVQLGSQNSAVTQVALWNTGYASWMDLRTRDVRCQTLFYEGQTHVSDATLKQDVTPIHGALDTVARLRGVRFRWKARGPASPLELGVIAQEVRKVVPEAVTATSEGLGVSEMMLVPLLIEAVKQLKTEVEDLRAEVKRLGATPRTGSKAAKARA